MAVKCADGCTCGRHSIGTCPEGCTCGKHLSHPVSDQERSRRRHAALGNQYSLRHGESTRKYRSPENTAWQNMKARCLNPNNPRWKDYGGRGITVCQRWMVFENFLADMGRRPTSEHSLDRIDNDGNYEPGNCRWATREEQVASRSPGNQYLGAR